MPHKLVPLGKNGPLVPQLGFGLMGMSHDTYGSLPSDEERFKILDRAYELGARFWDSSDLYGDNERLVGDWFRRTGKRNEIFFASKFGFVKGSKTLEIDSSGEYCKKACEESLKILGIDYIDLYYVHHVNPKTPIEETMRAMLELKQAGKIKYIGLSSISSATLLRAIKIAPVDAVQMDYSPFVTEIEGPEGTDLLATTRKLGIACVAAMPLGRGMITSTFASGSSIGDSLDKRPLVMPRFQEANRKHNEQVMKDFEGVAKKKGITIAQLALAWLLKQGDDIIPIPGTKRFQYLEENWKAGDVDITDEEEKEVRKFVGDNEVKGATLPPAFKDYNYRDTADEN